MALIQPHTHNRVSGEYWMIVQNNENRGSHPDGYTELCCYTNAVDRAADKEAGIFSPLPIPSVAFNFTPSDHPVSEILFDPDDVQVEWASDPALFHYHILYLHIKALAAYANARQSELQEGEELTPNERTSLIFVGATDDVP